MDDSRQTLYWGITTLTGSIFLAFALSPLYLRATMMPFVGMPALLLLLGISLAGMCRVSYLFYTAKRTAAAWLGLFAGIIAIAFPTLLVIHSWRLGLENKIIVQSIEAGETMRMLNSVLAEYQSKYGHLPATLAVLGPPPAGVTLQSEKTAALIDIELARGEKHGYRFTTRPGTRMGMAHWIRSQCRQIQWFPKNTA
jgi:hypothetical protein